MAKRSGRDRDYYDYGFGDGGYFPPSTPIPTDKGIRARSQRGKFGQSWWSARWNAALERFTEPNRLQRGRRYARAGQVLSIREQGGAVGAQVQGSRPQPYRVTIRLAPLADEQWDKVVDQMAAQAVFAAQLLNGEMPAEIEEAFSAANASLFPERQADLITDCSCPDSANPCKHVAAVYYILGEQFDEDPFLIFRLRGRTQEQVMSALRARRAGELLSEEEDETEAPEPLLPLAQAGTDFWGLAEPIDDLAVAIQPPAVPLPLLKRLGPPAFLPEDDLTLLLTPAYRAITKAALEAAFGQAGRSRMTDTDE